MYILYHNNFAFLFSFVFMQNLEGISDIRDESDRSGMRVVIEVKYLNVSGPNSYILLFDDTFMEREKNPKKMILLN